MIALPLPVAKLSEALPHRPPMVWVDEVLEASATAGRCAVDLNEQALYYGRDGQVLTFAAVEWLAQAYGYSRATYEVRSGAASGAVRRAFLVGVSDMVLAPRPWPVTGRLYLDVKLSRELPPLALIAGQVRTVDGRQLASATLKLYFER